MGTVDCGALENKRAYVTRQKSAEFLHFIKMADNLKDDKADLSKALRNIEENLSEVLSSIQKLNEESRQAKEEITEVFGRQLSHLHGRETQLLRQVDVIFRARSEVLQNQLAYCYRLLGALKSSNSWTGNNGDFSGRMIDFSGLKRWPTSTELNWNLNENSLNEAIANFGHVDMDGVLMLSRGEQSKCLPARIEEYFEDDHHVMNKPLHSMDSNIIEIKFPKLPKDYSFWLSRSKQQEEKTSLEPSYGPYRKGVDNFKPCDVQTWLGSIQGETAAEPMEGVDATIPDLVSLSDTTSTSSSKTSDSIEIVSSSAFCHNSNETNNHLTSGTMCNLGLVNVEIESLGDIFTACWNDKQTWLASSNKRNESISLAKSCRANEICDSFDSCLSDTNCQEVARENRQDKEKQQQKQLDHVTILPKTAGIDWLRPAANQSPASETTPQLSVLYSDSNNDYSQWLRRPVPAVAHKIKDDVNLQVKIQSLSLQSPKCDDNQWLRSSPNLKDDCKESIIKEAVDMMQSPWSQWLRC